MQHKFQKGRFDANKKAISDNIDHIIGDIYAHINSFEEYELFINKDKTAGQFQEAWQQIESIVSHLRKIKAHLIKKIEHIEGLTIDL